MSGDGPDAAERAVNLDAGEAMERAGTNDGALTVSQISNAVKRQIEHNFDHIRVRGEIGRVARPSSGHLYFDLKDEKSVLASVCWRGVAQGLAVQPEQGLEVICSGSLTTFAGQSRYQLVVQSMAPAGAGALMALLEERRRKFQAEGLFDPERKRDLPYLPEVIGVVTSPSGAVIRDILHRLADRFPRHVLVWPVRVQGEGCADQVARAIDGFNALSGDVPRPDLLIVARGGGSLEDLWGFNEEVVVRAVARSKIPVISAIGHETDTTLIDYVADHRAPTPTAAAEIAVPVRSELRAVMANHHYRLEQAMQRSIRHSRMQVTGLARGLPRPQDLVASASQSLDMFAQRLSQSLERLAQSGSSQLALLAQRLSPRMMVQDCNRRRQHIAPLAHRLDRALRTRYQQKSLSMQPLANRLHPRLLHMVLKPRQYDWDQRLNRQMTARLKWCREQLVGLSRQLALVSHESVLARGFALVRDPHGEAVRDADRIAVGQMVHIQTARGTPFQAQRTDGAVISPAQSHPVAGAGSPAGSQSPDAAPRRPSRKPVPPSDQGDLF